MLYLDDVCLVGGFEGSFESSFWEKLDSKMVPTMPGNNAYQHI